MHVGNDIVALKEAFLSRKEKNIRWINKVFTNREKQLIFDSNNPALVLWYFWSCKESVYKVILKMERIRFYNPKRIEVQEFNALLTKSKVKYEVKDFVTDTKMTENYIHTTCTNKGVLIGKTEECYAKGQEFDGSFKIRENLKNRIKSESKDLDVLYSKDSLGIPQIMTSPRSISYDVSFSHDGNYSAYAFAKIHDSI